MPDPLRGDNCPMGARPLVPMGRIELPTSPLPRECSTTELHGLMGFVAFVLLARC